MRQAWINLYTSGYYHRSGKPGQYNVHPGDMYPTHKAALADIDPQAPYVATVPVMIPDDVQFMLGEVNPPWSQPTPLSETKAIYAEGGQMALLQWNEASI